MCVCVIRTETRMSDVCRVICAYVTNLLLLQQHDTQMHGDGSDGDFGNIGLDVSKIYKSFRESDEFEAAAGAHDVNGFISGDVGYSFNERELQDTDWHLGNNGNERRSFEAGVDDAGPLEEEVDGDEGEVRIYATVSNAYLDDYRMRRSQEVPADAPATVGLCTTLRGEGVEVKFVEHLLSALEACGVDNCRIEVEGGDEVPIIDGSAVPWNEAIMDAGVGRARGKDGADEVRRLVRAPETSVTVHEGESYITFVPGPKTHFTVGIDHRDRSSAIGKSFFSWCPETDLVYRLAVAPARTYNVLKDVDALLKDGLLRGGSTDNGIVADGKYWCTGFNRFGDDEPTRHRLLDLIGDLSLMAANGNAGLPRGHIISFNNGAIKSSLNLKFAKALVDAYGDRSWEPAAAVDPDIDAAMGKKTVEVDTLAKKKKWDMDEFEYRTGKQASDANTIFKSYEEEREWSKQFWEYRAQTVGAKDSGDGGSRRSGDSNVDKITID